MKILYFSPHPHINMSAPSGPGTHIREIIEGFEQQGHQVIRLIAGGEQPIHQDHAIVFKKRQWKKLIPSIIWETLRDVLMIRADLALQSQLYTLAELEKPDLIYERSCYGMGAGMRVARSLGIRYIVEMNAPYPEEKAAMQGSSLLGFLGQRHEKNQVSSAYRTIVVSSAMKNYLLRKTLVDSSRIVVVANAVNPKHIQPDPTRCVEIQSAFQLKKEHVVIGFVGSIFPYHGVDLLIEAFAHLEKYYPQIRLIIVGDGEVLPALRQRVEDLLLNNRIFFTGNVPHSEVYNYLQLMNITVMAKSNWYGSPVKIFEYGAMGKAIIAPKVIPVEDVMTHGEHGLLIEGTRMELIKALTCMLDQPEQSYSMALAFQKKVMAEHTWQKVACQILDACK
jgi:glycosyltransferase involved in cell wall biosynthesis